MLSGLVRVSVFCCKMWWAAGLCIKCSRKEVLVKEAGVRMDKVD